MRHSRARVLRATGFATLCLLVSSLCPAVPGGRGPSLAELTARADRIVVADVLDVRCQSENTRDGEVPLTLVTVRTIRTLKGAASTQLVLEFLGGALPGDSLEVGGQPVFVAGDRDVLFLRTPTRAVSPLVAAFHGRYRVLAPADQAAESVADHDGRPLSLRDIGAGTAERAGTGTVTLARFERAVRELVGAASTPADGSEPDLDVSALSVPLPPLLLYSALGPAPTLFDSCDGWPCAISMRRLFRDATVSADESLVSAAAGERVSLTWGRAIFGRETDPDLPAVTARRATADGASTTIVFNDRLVWNSYEGPLRRLASGQPVLDLPRVMAQEVSTVLPPAATGTATARAADRTRSSRAAGAGSRAGAVEALDTTGCDPGGVVVDPRLLIFNSADHALMTAYQVGFFRTGAAAATQVVDVPLSAFLVRMVVDLPSSVVKDMQGSLVLDIRGAGLATPIGSVFTYRVRGVWAGGTTAWSDPSPSFVRCTS